MQCLLHTLDEELQTLEALVLCTQREQEHLLAYEPDRLEGVLDEKRRLLRQQDAQRCARERAVTLALQESHASAGETLSDLIDQLPTDAARPLSARRARMRALLGALAELSEVARFHAHRHLRFVRDCRSQLGGGVRNGAQTGYDAVGRVQRRNGGGQQLNGCA